MKLAKLLALLSIAGTAWAGTSSPPAGNYVLNVSTIAAKPAFNVSSGTVRDQLKLSYGTLGNLLYLDSTGIVTTTTTAPAGGDAVKAATQTFSGFNTFNSSSTFKKQVKVQTTGAGQGQGVGGSILVWATDETGMPFQIYSSSANQAGFFGLINLINSNTNYANAYLYINGASSTTGKASAYITDPNPNIQFVQTGAVSPAGQYEFMVLSDTMQFRSMNAGGTAYKPRLGMGHPGQLLFYETSDNGHFVALKASATIPSNVTWVLPPADGTAGQALQTDGAGNLSFGSTVLQSSGVPFGSATNTITTDTNTFTWNNTNKTLNLIHQTQGGTFFRVDDENIGSNIDYLFEMDQSPATPSAYLGFTNTFSGSGGPGITMYDGSKVEFARFDYQNKRFNIGGTIGTGVNTINTSGNVGIGSGVLATAAPTNGLLVQGNVTMQSSAAVTGAGGFSTTYGVTAGSYTANGTGNGQVTLTISGSTYTVTSTSGPTTVGQLAVFTSTNGTVGNGGTGGGGSGTPGGSNYNVQFASAGAFSGSTGFNVHPSSVVVSSPFSLVTTTFTSISSTTLNTTTNASTTINTTTMTLTGAYLAVVGTSTLPNAFTVSTATAGGFMLKVDTQGYTSIAGNLYISSGVLLSNSAGTNGQVYTSGGAGAVPSWTTVSAGGGGSSSLAVTTGSPTGYTGAAVSSPTAVVNLSSNTFTVQLTGSATAFINLNSSSVTLQGNAFNGASQLAQLNGSGVMATANLPTTVVYTDTNQGISGVKTFTSSTTHTDTLLVSTNVVVTSTGTLPALKVTANGVYGTASGTSGGLLLDCSGGALGSGMCMQMFSSAGAQGALGGMLNIFNTGSGWNEPGIYIKRSNSNNNSDIRIDATGTPAITLNETSESGSAAKSQLSQHVGTSRWENRNVADSAFDSGIILSSAAANSDVAIGQGYNSATTAQLQVITSTKNINTLTLSTAAVGGNKIAFSTSSEITFNGSAGTNGQLLTSGGVGTIPSWSGPLTVTNPVLLSGSNFSLGLISLSTGVTSSLPAASIASGVLGTQVIASSVAVGAIGPANAAAGTYHIVADTASFIPSLVSLSTGVTSSLPAASIASGVLGAQVIASSLAVNSVAPANVAAGTYHIVADTAAFISSLVSVSTGVVGTLQAAQFPALTGDVTTSAGNLATTLAVTQANMRTITSSITVTGAGGIKNTYGVIAGTVTDQSSTAHGVAIGEGNATPMAYTTAGTAGAPLVSGGSADPAFGFTLGSAGNAVTFASNTITQGTTIYYGGTMLTSASTEVFTNAFQVWTPMTKPAPMAEGAVYADSTQHAWQGQVAGATQTLSGYIWAVSGSSKTDTTAGTVNMLDVAKGVGTLTLPANFWAVGKSIYLVLHGTFTTTGTPTLISSVTLGGIGLAGTAAVTLGVAAGTAVDWRMEVFLTCYSTGASGKIVGEGIMQLFNSSSVTSNISLTPTTNTIDTTVAKAIQWNIVWGTSSISNSLTLNSGFVKMVM